MNGEDDKQKTEKIRYHVLWREQDQTILKRWWDKLKEIKLANGKTKSNRGERAKLRRCATPEEVLLQPYFHELQQDFPDNSFNTLALAAVAGLLAHIEEPKNISFAKQLGEQKEKSGKPVFSELRFQQLMASRDLNELYDNLRRAIMQTGRSANIISVADGVLHWFKEQHDKNQFNEKPEQRFQFTWAKAYFGEVLTYSKEK